MKLLYSVLLLIPFTLAFTLVAASCAGAESYWRSFGARGGFSDASDGFIHEYEIVAVYQLPWDLRSRSGWGVAPQLEITAGALAGNTEVGFIGSCGPNFSLGRTGFPLEVNGGASLAVLSRDTFGTRDLNGYAQFVTRVGLDYRVTPRLGLGYRFQHISNARLNGHRNPGDNLHLFGVQWYLDRRR